MSVDNRQKTVKTVTHTAGAATLATAVVAASDFIPSDLSAELVEKITSGGLTVNSIITAVLVWLTARNRIQVKQLQDTIDELTKDADTPPATTPPHNAPDA